MKQALSLKARAIALLSQREHSAAELRRKLLRIQAAAHAPESEEPPDEGEVDTLLVWLQAQGYLSEARFVESRINARAGRYGNLRIKQELAQHGLALGAEAQDTLKASELERARAVWQRKFAGAAAEGPDEERALRAKQMRFLTGRGFAPEVVRQVLRDRPGNE